MGKTIIFIGAGFAAPFGFPTTPQILKKLRSQYFNDIPMDENTRQLMNKVIQAFLHSKDMNDIEDILQMIYQMDNDYNKTNIDNQVNLFWDFLEKWNFTANINLGRTIGAIGQNYNLPISQIRKSLSAVRDLIEKTILETYAWSSERYNDNITTKDEREILIDKLLRVFMDRFFASNGGKLQYVFTTNYDTIVEQLGLRYDSYHVEVGFQPNRNHNNIPTFTGEFPTLDPDVRQINYFKIHGSVEWKEHEDERVGIIFGVEGKDMVIQPSHSPKIAQDIQPYKQLLKEFDAQLTSAKTLIVIGCSYRDEIITGRIGKFISDKTNQLIDVGGENLSGLKNWLGPSLKKQTSNVASFKKQLKLQYSNIKPVNLYFSVENLDKITNQIF